MAEPSQPPESFQVDLTRSHPTWDAATKRRRALWEMLVKPLFRLMPRRANGARIYLLRMMGAKIGHTCLIEAGVNILMPWNLELGDYAAIGRGTEILNFARVSVGAMTVVSQRSHLCAGSHDYTHPHFPLASRPITIGPECWIATEAFIGPGVTVGRGAVVGARSVAMKSLPEWTVCAGNPCQPIKPRVMKKLSPDR